MVTFAQCLVPPDFEIVPIENQPTSLDESQLSEPPGRFYTLTDCRVLQLDLSGPVVVNPDQDTLFFAWFVNYTIGEDGFVDDFDVGEGEFTFDPCTNAKVQVGFPPNVIEVVILDRQPEDDEDAIGARTSANQDFTSMSAVWTVFVEDTTCCL